MVGFSAFAAQKYRAVSKFRTPIHPNTISYLSWHTFRSCYIPFLSPFNHFEPWHICTQGIFQFSGRLQPKIDSISWQPAMHIPRLMTATATAVRVGLKNTFKNMSSISFWKYIWPIKFCSLETCLQKLSGHLFLWENTEEMMTWCSKWSGFRGLQGIIRNDRLWPRDYGRARDTRSVAAYITLFNLSSEKVPCLLPEPLFLPKQIHNSEIQLSQGRKTSW